VKKCLGYLDPHPKQLLAELSGRSGAVVGQKQEVLVRLEPLHKLEDARQQLVPAVEDAVQFVEWLKANKNFLFLTNDSTRTPRELSEKLFRMGIEVSQALLHVRAGDSSLSCASEAQGERLRDW